MQVVTDGRLLIDREVTVKGARLAIEAPTRQEGQVDRDTSGGQRIAVAVLTYRRTHALPEVVRVLRDACSTLPGAGVLVVDNNPSGSAAPVVQGLVDPMRPWALRYVHEPTPGIAAARNRAIEESADAELLVFIDDDERPTQGWLESMVRLYNDRRPAAIAGPVVTQFPIDPDPWIVAGGFFDRRRMPSGTSISVAATNNLLLDVAKIDEFGLRFDDRFGITGGSDTLFTKQLVRKGGLILWCDEAVVIDMVPPSRVTRRWVLQKAFRMGNVLPRTELVMATSKFSRIAIRVAFFLRAISRMGAGLSQLCFGAISGSEHQRARGVRLVARGSGMLLAALGYTYAEYARNERRIGGASWWSKATRLLRLSSRR